MSNRMSRLSSLLVVMLIVGGCGGNSGLVSTLDNSDAGVDTNDGGDVSTQLDATGDATDATDDTGNDTGGTTADGPTALVYCMEAGRTVCERLYECSSAADSLRNSLEEEFGFDDQHSCRERLTRRLAEFCQPADLSAQKGRATYQPTAAADCLEQLQTTSCETVFQGLPPLRTKDLYQPSFCDDIAVAKREESESCLANSDCTGDSAFCDGSVYVGNTATAGTCAMPAEAGGSCVLPADCGQGLYCDDSGTCAVPPAQGEACTTVCGAGLLCNFLSDTCEPPGAVSDPCALAVDCQSGLVCDTATNECSTAPALDESCNGVCQSGLKCDPDTDVCVPLPAQGESCSGECADGLTCSSDSKCIPVAGEGDSCATSECTAGLLCSNSDTCVVPAKIGASCQPGSCIWYADCSASGICEARPTLGQACTDECIEPSICSGGTCVDPSSLEECDGGSCSASDEFCDNGLCVKG